MFLLSGGLIERCSNFESNVEQYGGMDARDRGRGYDTRIRGIALEALSCHSS